MADSPYWTIEWENETYRWEGLSSLTAGRLRAFKSFFPDEEFGKANAFNQSFLQGDVDAVSCVIWALLKERNKTDPSVRFPDRPQLLPDFSVGDLVSAMYTELITRTAGEVEDPTEAPVEEPLESDPSLTPDLIKTSMSGEEGSLPRSRKSSGTVSTK